MTCKFTQVCEFAIINRTWAKRDMQILADRSYSFCQFRNNRQGFYRTEGNLEKDIEGDNTGDMGCIEFLIWSLLLLLEDKVFGRTNFIYY